MGTTSDQPSSGRTNGNGRGGKQRGSSEKKSYRGGHGTKKTGAVSSSKFKGNCIELTDHIFDCSDYKQADKYVTNIKRIAEYVGSEYKNGGDIRSTLENKIEITIGIPIDPVIIAPATALSTAQTLIFKGQIDQYIKRLGMLQENMQKAYSLILGQCTELLRAKIKQSNTWRTVSTSFNVLGLSSIYQINRFQV